MILKDKLIKLLSEFHDEDIEVLNISGTADEIIALFAIGEWSTRDGISNYDTIERKTCRIIGKTRNQQRNNI